MELWIVLLLLPQSSSTLQGTCEAQDDATGLTTLAFAFELLRRLLLPAFLTPDRQKHVASQQGGAMHACINTT